ncbi:hypothetical protein [Streptomyces sp. NPDC000229]|uniref:hypothetical protein n=1 Tax=Streptomyces sp. NPDC000229 TaxID=3154247 RepID=UPI00332A9543
MTGLWRQVLALGAAEHAHARRTGTEPVTVEDVRRIALTEFSMLLDDTQARAALIQQRGPAR